MKSLPGHFNNPMEIYNLHIDIVGPLLNANESRYLLKIMDHFSRWPAVFATEDISAETVTKTFLEQWITTYGVPFFFILP